MGDGDSWLFRRSDLKLNESMSDDALKTHPRIKKLIHIEAEKLLAKMKETEDKRNDSFIKDASNIETIPNQYQSSISGKSAISELRSFRKGHKVHRSLTITPNASSTSTSRSDQCSHGSEPIPSTSTQDGLRSKLSMSPLPRDTSSFSERPRQRKNVHKSKAEKVHTETRINIRKNIDASLYLSNPQSKVCVICNKSVRHIVHHYKTVHKDHEVFVSRLSPFWADAVKIGSFQFNMFSGPLPKYDYRATCFFCESSKDFSPHFWMKHIRSHTGEYANHCKLCNQVVCYDSHCGQTTDTIEQDVINLRTTDLIAFICLECNFVQMKIENMHKHLMNEHDFQVDHLDQRYNKFVLLPAVDGQLSQGIEGKRNHSIFIREYSFF